MSSKQEKVLKEARKRIGSKEWSKDCIRKTMDGKATIGKSSKCNVFVYEMLVAGGVNIPLIQNLKPVPFSAPIVENNIPRVEDWYNRKFPGMQ